MQSIVAELEKTHRKHPNSVADLAVVTAQEIAPKGNLLVQVVGSFEEQKAQTKHRFSHTFILAKELTETHEVSFYIQNEVLVYLSGSPNAGGRRNQPRAQKAEAAAPAAAATNGAAAAPLAHPAPSKTSEPATAPAGAGAVAQAAPKEKRQPKAKNAAAAAAAQAKPKEEKPAQPAAPKPTTWASITNKVPSSTASTATVAAAPAPTKPKAAAPAPAKPAESSKPAPAPAAAAAPKTDKLSLFVGNLTPNVDEAQLRKAFSAFGKVTRVDVVLRKNIGFVSFDEPASGFDALNKKFQANPVKLDGKTLRIDLRDSSSRKPAPTNGAKPASSKDKGPADDLDLDEVPTGSAMDE